jgi:toxin FitB
MKQSVVLDTDISSLYIKGRLPLVWRDKLVGFHPFMTFITRGELVQWTLLRNLGNRRTSEVRSWIGKSFFLPGDGAVTEVYGRLTAAAALRGRPRKGNDAWIAACCVSRRLPLATLNTKDFADFAEHDGLELITA